MNSSSVPAKAPYPSAAAAAICFLRMVRGDWATSPVPSSQVRSLWMVTEFGCPGVRRSVARSISKNMSP